MSDQSNPRPTQHAPASRTTPGPAGESWCPYCKTGIRDDLLRCPACTTWLSTQSRPSRVDFGTIFGAVVAAQLLAGLVLVVVLFAFGTGF